MCLCQWHLEKGTKGWSFLAYMHHPDCGYTTIILHHENNPVCMPNLDVHATIKQQVASQYLTCTDGRAMSTCLVCCGRAGHALLHPLLSQPCWQITSKRFCRLLCRELLRRQHQNLWAWLQTTNRCVGCCLLLCQGGKYYGPVAVKCLK